MCGTVRQTKDGEEQKEANVREQTKEVWGRKEHRSTVFEKKEKQKTTKFWAQTMMWRTWTLDVSKWNKRTLAEKERNLYHTVMNLIDAKATHSLFLSFLLCRTTKRNDTFHFGMLNARWSCVCVRAIVFKIWIWNVDVAKHSQAAVIITSRSSSSDSVNSHRAVLCEVIRECRQSAHAFFIPSVSRTELSWVELRRVEPSTVCLLSPCVSVSAYVVIHSGDGNSSSSSSISIIPLTIPYQTDDAWQIRNTYDICANYRCTHGLTWVVWSRLNWSRFNDHFLNLWK